MFDCEDRRISTSSASDESGSVGRALPSVARIALYCLVCVLFSRIFLLAVGVLSQASAGMSGDVVDLWFQWDANWYSSIVQEGYHKSDRYFRLGWSNLNFFPLFPSLVWLFSIVVDVRLAGLIVSNAVFCIGVIYLYLYCQEHFSQRIAEATTIAICFGLGSFVFSAPMTESLFFTLTVVAAYHMRRQQ